MSEFASSVQSQFKQFDSAYAQNYFLNKLEAKTKLPKSYLAFGSSVAYLLLIFINVGGIGEIMSNIAGFVIPTYFSLVALKTKSTDDDTQLLTYWIVFAFMSVLEFWSKAILFMIPFYWFAKTIFLVYICLPQTGGAKMIYMKIIAPLTDKYIKVPLEAQNNVHATINGVSAGQRSSPVPPPPRATGVEVHPRH